MSLDVSFRVVREISIQDLLTSLAAALKSLLNLEAMPSPTVERLASRVPGVLGHEDDDLQVTWTEDGEVEFDVYTGWVDNDLQAPVVIISAARTIRSLALLAAAAIGYGRVANVQIEDCVLFGVDEPISVDVLLDRLKNREVQTTIDSAC